MTTTAIEADGLRKRYRATTALDGFHLSVPAGTVCGLLGPNGAGKTTAVRILTTLLSFDAGRAVVAGADVAARPGLVRGRIALTGQYAAVDGLLSGRQNLVLFGRLYGLDRRTARRRADELLTEFGLTDAADRSAAEYSGGMQRRLDLAASLIRRPQVLFLDEPTTGLDPRSRNQVWDAIRKLVTDGVTVLLTTQYLDEADQLADRISVVDNGRMVAEGTPRDLKATIGADRLELVVREASRLSEAAALAARLTGAEADTDPDTRRVRVAAADPVAALTGTARALHDAGITVEDIAIRRPTLDEAFLHLTAGRPPSAASPPSPSPSTPSPSAAASTPSPSSAAARKPEASR